MSRRGDAHFLLCCDSLQFGGKKIGKERNINIFIFVALNRHEDVEPIFVPETNKAAALNLLELNAYFLLSTNF